MIGSLVVVFAASGLTGLHYLLPPGLDTAVAQLPPVTGQQTAIDLTPRPLDHIPVGTVIGANPPTGWSHLVLFATPALTPEDLRDAPRTAADYARMFKFTVLADVGSRNDQGRPKFFLNKLARGFAIDLKGKETIVDGNNTLGASLGLFGRRVLDENEKILDEDVRQVLRTPNLLIFDAKAVMRQRNEHVPMVVRHAVLVQPETGKLTALVWLLTREYQTAEPAVQVLPNGMREQRLLSVKRDEFTLGIPSREAFALRRIPQGKPVAYDERLRWAATLRTFSAQIVPDLTAILTTAAEQGTKK
jgi:hypothetical protein